MRATLFSTLLLLPVLPSFAHKACKGSCDFDAPKHKQKHHRGSAKLRISGGSHAVSDLTTDGGWTVLSCNASTLEQDVRIVCHSAACEHLFEGHGAIDTLVRLPEDCGASPFARVADIKLDPDQSVPAAVEATYDPSGNLTSTVFVARIDTDFAAVNATKVGPVSFSLEGYNFEGPDLNVSAPATSEERREIRTRNWTSFNKTNSIDLPPIQLTETFPILSASLGCTTFNASVSAALSTNIDTTISLGLIVAGSVIPPRVKEFSVFTGLDGKIAGTLQLDASAQGTVSTGKKALWETALAGIDFPGVFTLGPTFGIYGELIADLDADLSVAVDLTYTADNARIYFPADPEGPSAGAVNTGNSKLSLAVIPTLATKNKFTAHLFPEIKLALSAFTFVKAEVYLDVDASASLTLDLDASATASVGVKQTQTSTASAPSVTETDKANGKVSGKVEVGAAVSVNVGADGSMFGTIKASDKYALFSDKWTLYDQTFKTSGATSSRRRRRVRTVSTRDDTDPVSMDLTCPALTENDIISELETIVEGIFEPTTTS
ncbi:hypothetical protein C8F01DRAFT_1024956 [Mycena amicta]|nr:hypothetical protein C8F01DRAFT_1024956 [Mycena amicta]